MDNEDKSAGALLVFFLCESFKHVYCPSGLKMSLQVKVRSIYFFMTHYNMMVGKALVSRIILMFAEFH